MSKGEKEGVNERNSLSIEAISREKDRNRNINHSIEKQIEKEGNRKTNKNKQTTNAFHAKIAKGGRECAKEQKVKSGVERNIKQIETSTKETHQNREKIIVRKSIRYRNKNRNKQKTKKRNTPNRNKNKH
jgi:hypothetical protein